MNTFAGRNNGRNPESPEFSEPPFSGFISPQQNLAMQHMRNIGMFEQKTPLRETSRQCFFLSRIQHIAQQNTWAVSGCRYFFYWQDVCRTPSTARVTLIGGSPHLVSSLQPPFISYLGKFGRGTTPVRGLTIQS